MIYFIQATYETVNDIPSDSAWYVSIGNTQPLASEVWCVNRSRGWCSQKPLTATRRHAGGLHTAKGRANLCLGPDGAGDHTTRIQ